ncbi:hypothetical protein HN682_05280 [Candidatus Peregrinibacteria bacterium]|jgi:hypothetical protein|uniref:Uncharacterized protein n=1 Tax=uncultured marine virus TaxID=186617 RepID=A0A0F7L2L1_9VIRU|nr:hypothetical protein [uncultured marine virus]MBT6051109.1 hypothetical protein [Candidatus Scalindua sp.]MBT7929309.1 hypothetical protein [Candidatus Peregrinibacteria bacterium]
MAFGFTDVAVTKAQLEFTAVTAGTATASKALVTNSSGYMDKVTATELQLNDTNNSNTLALWWNEDDSSDRTLAFKVNGASPTLDLLTGTNVFNMNLIAKGVGATTTFTVNSDADQQTSLVYLSGASTNLWNLRRKANETDLKLYSFGVANDTIIFDYTTGETVFNYALFGAETTTPTARTNFWSVYGKADNSLYFQDGAGTEHLIHPVTAFKSFTLSDVGNAGIHYTAGWYRAAAADETLTIGGTVTRTYGTAGQAHGAHAFCVASGAGGTDLVLTVTGVSITDAGVRNDADSEIIVADADAASTDEYFETSKKWLGQVTYTLTGSSGAFTFNYGFCKYEDFGNKDFTVTDFEMGDFLAGASETGLNVKLKLHSSSGWTYHASAFVPGGTTICDLATDYGTNNDIANGDDGSYKRAALSQAVLGSSSQGIIVEVTTAVNNSIDAANFHVGVNY